MVKNDIFSQVTGFQWDRGNRNKISGKHGLGNQECEEPFFNRPKYWSTDSIHSTNAEKRWILYGVTDKEKRLVVVFTIRKDKIRIISARPLNKKEEVYFLKCAR